MIKLKVEIIENIMSIRILSSVIATIILFQSLVVAPIANLELTTEGASVFLRCIWPIFFNIIGILSLVNLFSNYNHKYNLLVNGITVLFMTLCYVLVTPINNAMDDGDMTTWKVLHLLTVGLTLTALILHLTLVFRWYKHDVLNAH